MSARVKQLESLRAVVHSAMTTCQGALLAIEAIIASEDETDTQPTDEFAGQTFEDTPPPTIRRSRNGQR